MVGFGASFLGASVLGVGLGAFPFFGGGFFH